MWPGGLVKTHCFAALDFLIHCAWVRLKFQMMMILQFGTLFSETVRLQNIKQLNLHRVAFLPLNKTLHISKEKGSRTRKLTGYCDKYSFDDIDFLYL